MKNTKKYHTVLAAASIALAGIIPATFGGEKNQVVQNIAPVVLEQDQVQTRINTAIIDPLNFQAERFSQFSRRMPTESTRYHLAETENSIEGERTFKVVKTSTPLMKGKNATSSDFLKVRYIENTSSMLVDLKNKWVKLEEHPVLKSLPKMKPAPQKITP